MVWRKDRAAHALQTQVSRISALYLLGQAHSAPNTSNHRSVAQGKQAPQGQDLSVRIKTNHSPLLLTNCEVNYKLIYVNTSGKKSLNIYYSARCVHLFLYKIWSKDSLFRLLFRDPSFIHCVTI